MNEIFPYNCFENLNDPKYNSAIESLISCYKAISQRFNINIDNGGALGFYRYDIDANGEQEQKMKMRIWPLGDEFFSKHFPEDDSIRKSILSAINRKRDYEILEHLVHFEKKHNVGYPINTDCHYVIEFDKEDIISYDSSYVTIESNRYTWQEIADNLNKLNGDNIFYARHIKQLDHLLFTTEMSKILVIPIPVLTSPAILFFFNYKDFEDYGEDRIADFIVELTEAASEVVRFYLFNRVLIEFGREVKIDVIKDENQLFAHFSERVANIFLPLKYKIDNHPFCNYFKWYEAEGNGMCSSVKLEFNNLDVEKPYKHRLELVLPDYAIPYNLNGKGKKISKKLGEQEYHQLSLNRITTTLNNIYHLIVKSWLPYEMRNSIWVGKIEPVLEDLRNKEKQFKQLAESFNFDELNNKISDLKEEVRKLNAGDNKSKFELYKQTDKSWVFTFDENRIFEGKEYIGLNILHQILLNEGKQIRWEELDEYCQKFKESVSSLGEYETGILQRKSSGYNNIITSSDYMESLKTVHDLFKIDIPGIIEKHFSKQGVPSQKIERIWPEILKTLNEKTDNVLKSLIENEEFYTLLAFCKSRTDLCYVYKKQSLESRKNEKNEKPELDITKESEFINYALKFLKKNNSLLYGKVNNDYKFSGSGKSSPENKIVTLLRKNLEDVVFFKIYDNQYGKLIIEHFIDAGLVYLDEKGKPKLFESKSTRGPQFSVFKYELSKENRSNIKWRLFK